MFSRMITKHALAAIAGAAALCGVAAGQSQLYVGQYQYQAAKMTSISLDGSNPQTLFTLDPDYWLPLGIVVNPATGKLVWIEAFAAVILQSDIDGGNLEVLSPISGFAHGISLDAQGRIYYATDNRVERVDADGSNQQVLFVSSTSDPILTPRVDATNGHVYFSAAGAIVRTDLDGGNVKTIFTGGSIPRGLGLDVAAGWLYWIDSDTITDFVARVRLDGSGFEILYDISPNDTSNSSFLACVLVDPASDTIYWSDEVLGNIWKGAADGSGKTLIYTCDPNFGPASLTFDTGEPAQAVQDCDGNGVPDSLDIAAGAADCDNNGRLDSCQTNPCPVRTILLDQGDDAAGSQARALGKPSQWQVFQPFDVPAGGWNVGEIGLDGYTINYIENPSGAKVNIYRDNPATSLPDESTVLATTTVDFFFSFTLENWVYAPLSVRLDEGRYWVRIEARDPLNFAAGVNHGYVGLPSRSRGASGNFTQAAPPIALRIVEKDSSCVGDFDGSGFVDTDDFDAFVHAFEAGTNNADVDGSGFVDTDDYDFFVHAFEAGC